DLHLRVAHRRGAEERTQPFRHEGVRLELVMRNQHAPSWSLRPNLPGRRFASENRAVRATGFEPPTLRKRSCPAQASKTDIYDCKQLILNTNQLSRRKWPAAVRPSPTQAP